MIQFTSKNLINKWFTFNGEHVFYLRAFKVQPWGHGEPADSDGMGGVEDQGDTRPFSLLKVLELPLEHLQHRNISSAESVDLQKIVKKVLIYSEVIHLNPTNNVL